MTTMIYLIVTMKTLILSSVTGDHSGSYECIVTNNWNVTTTSLPAMLTVTSNDNSVLC